MSIDPKRLAEYRTEIAAMQKQVSFTEFNERIFEKVFDYAVRNREDDFYSIKADINKIFSPEYERFVRLALSKYEQILNVTNDMYSDIGGNITKEMSRMKRLETLNRQSLGEYSDSALKKISKTISAGIYKEYDWKKLSGELQKLKGKTEIYADVLAQTQLKGYSRLAKAEKARIGSVEWFLYTGIIRETTRPFCLEHAGNYYHIDEINAMNNGPKQLKPVLVYCGGWRCIHELEPDPFYNKK